MCRQKRKRAIPPVIPFAHPAVFHDPSYRSVAVRSSSLFTLCRFPPGPQKKPPAGSRRLHEQNGRVTILSCFSRYTRPVAFFHRLLCGRHVFSGTGRYFPASPSSAATVVDDRVLGIAVTRCDGRFSGRNARIGAAVHEIHHFVMQFPQHPVRFGLMPVHVFVTLRRSLSRRGRR